MRKLEILRAAAKKIKDMDGFPIDIDNALFRRRGDWCEPGIIPLFDKPGWPFLKGDEKLLGIRVKHYVYSCSDGCVKYYNEDFYVPFPKYKP